MNTKVYRSKYLWAKFLKQHAENRKRIIDIDIEEYNQLHEYGLNDISAICLSRETLSFICFNTLQTLSFIKLFSSFSFKCICFFIFLV